MQHRFQVLIVTVCSIFTILTACYGMVIERNAQDIRLPMRFEPNLGQSAAEAKFLARGPGYLLMLGQDRMGPAAWRLCGVISVK